MVAVLALALSTVLTVVFFALWLSVRQIWRELDIALGLVHGLRRDSDAAVIETVGALNAHSQRIHTAHNTAAVANDRLMYYTKHSAILERIGAKYDKAIAALRAKAEADAAPAVAPEPESEDVAPEGMAQVAGSIGTPCG